MIDKILERWRQHAVSAGYNVERIKGTAFERLCIAFIEHDPVMQQTYRDPVPYEKWAQEHEDSTSDAGIDLVATLRGQIGPDGSPAYCAIQCKFYRKGVKIPKSGIDSFLAESGTGAFARRLIIDTTDTDFSTTAEDTLRKQTAFPVSRIGLQDLRNSPLDWESFAAADAYGIPERLDQPKALRPHQEEAFQAAVACLRATDTRGKLIMACGTGKTLTSLRIAEELAGQGRTVLCLVPSLALMEQMVHAWAGDARLNLRAFAVCSDAQVGRKRLRQDDRIDMEAHDLALPATTNAARVAVVAAQRDPAAMTVIFATYHSLPKIRDAQHIHGLADFDLAICDEAHRTAGAKGLADTEDSHFVMIHDQEHIRADRRLYMTATPKVYAQQARTRAGNLAGTLCSMEDTVIYGPVLYEIGFGAAVERDLLSDYKVIVLTVPANIAARAANTAPNDTLQMDDAGKLVGCVRALTKQDQDQFPEDDQAPMQCAIAYCRDIRSSQRVAGLFAGIAKTDVFETPDRTTTLPDVVLEARHVDGTFNALSRTARLDWLRAAGPEECRVLSNVRCLAEGVDIPSLDAILFMHPRKSQIEVVQAVGRVMRKTPGKAMGYVILPVVIPADSSPEAALDNNNTFRVVWQVLNAIRSHDERFEALINLIEAGRRPDERLSIISLSDWTPPTTGSVSPPDPPPPPSPDPSDPMPFEFDLPTAIQAKIVERCGNRRYWEEWAEDVADIAKAQIARIRALVNAEPAACDLFTDFVKELRDDLNEGVTEDDAIEMLAQHMITRPVFDALFGRARFVERNPVSRGLEMLLGVLRPAGAGSETEGLEEFYASVQRRAAAANSAAEKQKLAVELYDKFFRRAFPKTAQQLGIVYTPVEVVDFIIHSVNDVLREEFGQTLGTEGVHILDPFTGTGTFPVRLLQSGLIKPADLACTYQSELHANEIVLLAYYIAAVNIEAAYREVVGLDDEVEAPFTGICLSDTFESSEEDLFANVLKANSDRRERQQSVDIRVIIGNPPYSAGQRSENDAAQNQPYPDLDTKIRETYANASNATNKNALYDSYIRAIRWASDRIGASGVIGFITGSAWLERSFGDGIRKCLADEFSSIHVFHLRGDIRKNMLSGGRAGEGDNIFGQGSMTGCAIAILVKNPNDREQRRIRFHDIGDSLTQEQKLEKITWFGSIKGITTAGGWRHITPDAYGDWLDQRDPRFTRYTRLGSKDKSHAAELQLFDLYSRGVETTRDAWCCNFSDKALEANTRRMIGKYNAELERFGRERPADIGKFVDSDPSKIKAR
ncbi:MAG: DEAD/DEAH box helicase family protein [Rhodobacteraceae bacterium]|nr:DEAD/DEAH box helicase family protein [Paracoccaceae bacterium]